MKNKVILLITIIIITSVIMTGGIIFAVSELSKKDLAYKFDPEAENDEFGYFTNKNKLNEKLISNLWDDAIEIKYSESFNINSLSVEKRVDAYGTEDIYLDEFENKYYYLYNTNIFCGYLDYAGSVFYLNKNDIKIKEDDAIRISDNFIDEKLKPEIDYKYRDCQYDESLGTYIIIYTYYMNNIKTDDECIFRVRADNGKIHMFSNHNYKRFEKYKNMNISNDQLEERLEEKLEEVMGYKTNKEYNIVYDYLTHTEEGELVMYYFLRFPEQEIPHEYYLPVNDLSN